MALNEELKKQTWDDSVKALVSFPQVLEMLDSQLEWMQKLGDAILAQQKETMDAIQRLREEGADRWQSEVDRAAERRRRADRATRTR